jgi:arylsulfate sulfotransferase
MRKRIGLSVLPALFAASLISSCTKTGKSVGSLSIDSTTVDTLTQSVYTLDSTGRPTKGIIVTSPFDLSITSATPGQGLLLIMDQSGRVLQKQATPGSAFGLERWTINGQARYTYIVNDPSAPRGSIVGQNAGYAVIADSNLRELQRVDFVPFGTNLFPVGQPLDAHEFVLISDNHYIGLCYTARVVANVPGYLNPAPGGALVIVPIIEEVDNGAVVWTWDASTDTSFYGNSVEGNIFSNSTSAQDYIHMNSLFIDPRDGNLLCSMRNQDQIIKIDRHTGAIVWRLGGKNSDFPLASDQVFLRQHHATLTDNNQTLLLFDDGEATLRSYSRIVEFHLNETAKTITGSKYFDIPEPFSGIMGSVQKIGDEYFIGGGSANYMLEVNYNTGQKVMEYLGNMASYRSFKY